MEQRLNISSTQLSSYLIIGGLICNLMVCGIAFKIDDHTLMYLCTALAVMSIVGLLMGMMNKTNEGVHMILISYLLVFTIGSFTHISSYPLLLVYPILIGCINLFFMKLRIKNIYFGIILVAAAITIVNTHLFVWQGVNMAHLIGNLIVALSLLFAFVLAIKVHSMKIENSRDKRDENERLIIDKNLALKDYIKTNLQLENFAHLASHDLKTPIKNISNFSQLLDKRIGGTLSKKDQEILDLINEESQRMSGMMGDLLKLSQLSKKKMKYDKINGHQFINALIEENFDTAKCFLAVISFPLELVAAESHLHILFFNLIENANKFSKVGEEAKVTIYGRRSHEHYYFEVKDNGVGIDDKYKKSVFLIFNKLTPQIHSSGTGIGLSMCKEIVERHNGRIWIEDNNEGGTIVKFTLMRNLDELAPDSQEYGVDLEQGYSPLDMQTA